MMKPFAMFDLDHTLLPQDTMLLFCNFIIRKYPFRIFYLLMILPVLPFAVLKLIRSRELKRFFFSFLWGLSRDELHRLADEFAKTRVMPLIYPELKEEIAKHRKEGRLLILNTASPYLYASAIARELKFDECFATDMQIEERMPLLPVIKGENNKRDAKLRSMKRILPAEIVHKMEEVSYDRDKLPQLKNSYGYSDSPADLPMLLLAEHGVLINPVSEELLSYQKKKNWTIFTIEDKKKIRMRRSKHALLQALGLFSILFFLVSCTNYTSKPQKVNTPILLKIYAEGSGHAMDVSAQNIEIGFSGYRLYQGSSEDAVRNADDLSGLECVRGSLLPNQPVVYKVEVKPDQDAPSAGSLCNVKLKLTSGTYVAMRATISSLTNGFRTGLSSNALQVP